MLKKFFLKIDELHIFIFGATFIFIIAFGHFLQGHHSFGDIATFLYLLTVIAAFGLLLGMLFRPSKFKYFYKYLFAKRNKKIEVPDWLK